LQVLSWDSSSDISGGIAKIGLMGNQIDRRNTSKEKKKKNKKYPYRKINRINENEQEQTKKVFK